MKPVYTIRQYASSPCSWADCYAELAVSSPAVAEPSPVLIAPTRGAMARLRPGPEKYRNN